MKILENVGKPTEEDGKPTEELLLQEDENISSESWREKKSEVEDDERIEMEEIDSTTPVFTSTEASITHKSAASYSVAILDGMAEPQALKMPAHVNTCIDLSTEFCKRIESTILKYDETRLLF